MLGLAKRRPGWRLPDLPDGLAPDADDILFDVKKREPCPKWFVQEDISCNTHAQLPISYVTWMVSCCHHSNLAFMVASVHILNIPDLCTNAVDVHASFSATTALCQ